MSLSVAFRHRFPGLSLDIAFEAPRGITVLFGRSGAGKTTIVNAVAGLFRPAAGRIALEGTVLSDASAGTFLPPHRRRIGIVFQEGRLFPHLSVRQNLVYGQRFAPLEAPREDFDRIVDMLGIGPLLARRPAGLSGGEKQRVAIGRALLAAPRLILADEPLAALDEARKAEILPYFERLRDSIDIPVLYVSHAPAEVARLASSVVVIENGRVARQGAPGAVLADPSITPLGPQAAGSMLDAVVMAHHADGLSELAAGGTRLLVPAVGGEVGTPLRLFVAAQDVMLALDRPERVSALNVIPAVVADIRLGDGPGALVRLAACNTHILSRVTRRSVLALDLQPGQTVYAVLKAASVARDRVGSTVATFGQD